MLKQLPFQPVSVENQMAIVYAGINGYMDKVPVEKVSAFKTEYLRILESKHSDVMSSLRAGKYDDTLTGVLGSVAKDVAAMLEVK